MERCRSSEAVLGRPPDLNDVGRRIPKGTSLLFNTVANSYEIGPASPPVKDEVKEKGDWVHVESIEAEDDKMDVDEVEGVRVEEQVVWGMPKWGWEEERKEVRKGVRLVGMEEVCTDY